MINYHCNINTIVVFVTKPDHSTMNHLKTDGKQILLLKGMHTKDNNYKDNYKCNNQSNFMRIEKSTPQL